MPLYVVLLLLVVAVVDAFAAAVWDDKNWRTVAELAVVNVRGN